MKKTLKELKEMDKLNQVWSQSMSNKVERLDSRLAH